MSLAVRTVDAVSDAKPSAEAALLARLEREPTAFEFGTALRIAERSGLPVSIVADASTVLAPAAITRVERTETGLALHMTVGGLIGAFGALPPAYTQFVLEERKRRSRSLGAFLDVFADGLTRLLIAAQEKYRLPRLLRWRSRHNHVLTALTALVGLRSSELSRRSPVPVDTVLRYAGLFAARTRNATALCTMLADHLGLPVEIEQMVPRWIEVPRDQQTALGAKSGATLGVDTMAGGSVRDHAGGFRVVVGPVGYADYRSLEPGSARLERLMNLTRLYVGSSLRFDVQVVLRKEDVPFCRLGDPAQQPMLGWNSWARVGPAATDSRDAIIAARV